MQKFANTLNIYIFIFKEIVFNTQLTAKYFLTINI